MARKPSLLSLLLLICFQAAISVSCFQLTDEILHFVPDCARECFLSFLEVNYEENPCDRGTTSLQCLCAARGASGFTIGEGVVQCLAAEKAIKFCSLEEASDEVITRAFGMCNGKPNAIPATNTVFTATLILPPSGPGVVSFPPLTTTRTDFDDVTTTSSSTSTIRTTSEPTLETDTSEPPPNTDLETTSGFTTSVRTSTSEDTSTTEAPVPDIPAGEEDNEDEADKDGANGEKGEDGDKDKDSLGPAQVAGISVGVASAAGLAAIAILVARYYRRQRRLPELRSLFSKRDTWPYPEKGYGGGGDNPDGSGSMAGVARQINQPLDKGPGSGSGPPAYEGAGGWYSPATIGVAVASPQDAQPGQNNVTPKPRPLSRLLPAKPVYVPPGSDRSGTSSPSDVFRNATMVGAPARRREGSPLGSATFSSQRQQTLPLTLADTIQTRQQPSPGLSGTTATQQQSPRRFSPGLVTAQGSPKPRFQPSAQAARALPTANTNKPQPPIPNAAIDRLYAPPPVALGRDSNVTEFEEDGRFSRSTGVSTNNNNGARGSRTRQGSGGAQVWVPPSTHPISGLTYYFADQNGNWVLRDSQAGQQQPQQQQRQPREQHPRDSQSDIHPALRTNNTLAPAAEISKTSDLSYNNNNPYQRQQQQQAQQQWPRSSSIYSPNMPRPLFSGPRRTSGNRRSSDDSGITQFSAASSSGEIEPLAPPPHLSPVVESPPERVPRGIYPGTTFAGSGGRNANNLRLAAGPPRSARPYHPPGQPSPTLGLMIPPPVASQGTGIPNSTGPRAAYTDNTDHTNIAPSSQPRTLRAVSPSPPPDRDLLPSSQHTQDIVSPLSPLRPNLPFTSEPLASNYNKSTTTTGPWRPPRLTDPHYSHGGASSPTSSANTTTSSLLSKRLGPVRAADMSFPTVRPSSTQRKWEQSQRERVNGNGYLSPETPSRTGGDQQPRTPTWVPRLTPTRRGDDLYLNVQ